MLGCDGGDDHQGERDADKDKNGEFDAGRFHISQFVCTVLYFQTGRQDLLCRTI